LVTKLTPKADVMHFINSVPLKAVVGAISGRPTSAGAIELGWSEMLGNSYVNRPGACPAELECFARVTPPKKPYFHFWWRALPAHNGSHAYPFRNPKLVNEGELTMEQNKDKIRAFLLRYFQNHTLQDDEDIFATGFVNSLFAMQLVLFVESEFSIKIEIF
jgi:acyl carrier protein